MLGKTYAEDLRTIEDELFAVATMLFQIVMTGQFPYMRTGTDGDMVRLIKRETSPSRSRSAARNTTIGTSLMATGSTSESHPQAGQGPLLGHLPQGGQALQQTPDSHRVARSVQGVQGVPGEQAAQLRPHVERRSPHPKQGVQAGHPDKDCPTCGRKHAIAGIWNDDNNDYFVPRQCNGARRPAVLAIRCSANRCPHRRADRPAACKTAARASREHSHLSPMPCMHNEGEPLDTSRLCAELSAALHHL